MFNIGRINIVNVAAVTVGVGIALALVSRGEARTELAPLDKNPYATIIEMRAPLPSGAADGYAVWQDVAGFYGAFAAGPDGGHGWVWGFNTPEAAEADALARCDAYTDECQIIAVAGPETPPIDGHLVLGVVAQSFFADYEREPGRAAFATAEDGASGWTWGHRTLADARAAALTHCQEQIADRHVEMPILTCSIVDERGGGFW